MPLKGPRALQESLCPAGPKGDRCSGLVPIGQNPRKEMEE